MSSQRDGLKLYKEPESEPMQTFESCTCKKKKKKKVKKLTERELKKRRKVMELFALGISFILAIITLPFSLIFCLKTAKEFERAVIFRMGRIAGVHGPGLFFTLPCIEEYRKIDTRTKTVDVSQEVLTKDYVNVKLDGVVYYKVADPLKAVLEIKSFDQSTTLLAVSTLRNVASSRLLCDLLSDKNVLSYPIEKIMEECAEKWGVRVERVLINHIHLPTTLQKALAMEAEANREARAKLIAAEGEKNAAYSLKEASDIISESPGAMQLRYLQTLNSFPSDHKSTIIFPMPIDLISIFTAAHCTCFEGHCT